MTDAIPAGFRTVTPYLIIQGAAQAIEFYKRAFAATEKLRLAGPDQSVIHAEIKIGDSIVMLADEFPDMGVVGPATLGGAGVSICLYVDDVNAHFEKAMKAGAVEIRPLMDQFYGDRSGTLKDPFGHMWIIASHIEDLTPEQLQERFQEYQENL
nr:uncharacterized protein Mb0911c-like [Nerophis lumbriciformis]